MSSIPRSTIVASAVAVALAGALAWSLTRPPPPPPVTAEYEPVEPARPGDVNPIAAKALQNGGPRTPAAGSPGGPGRGVGRFAFAWDPAAPDGAWDCVASAARLAAALPPTEAGPDCQGAGPARLEGAITVVRRPSPAREKGVATEPAYECTATLATTGATPVRLSVGPIPAQQGDCSGIVPTLEAPLREALAHR